MSAQISFSGTTIPDGVIAGSCKHKQVLSLSNPDNTELQCLAIQAAKKKAKLSMAVLSKKEMTDNDDHNEANNVTAREKLSKPLVQQKKTTNCQLSVEEVDNPDNHHQRPFPHNPRNIIESDDDGSAGSHPMKTRSNVDNKHDDSDPDTKEEPAESAEAELSQ